MSEKNLEGKNKFFELSPQMRTEIAKKITDERFVPWTVKTHMAIELENRYPDNKEKQLKELGIAYQKFEDGICTINSSPKLVPLLKNVYRNRTAFIVTKGKTPDSKFLRGFTYDILYRPWNRYANPRVEFNRPYNVCFMPPWVSISDTQDEPISYALYQNLISELYYHHLTMKKIDGVGIFLKTPSVTEVREGEVVVHRDGKAVIETERSIAGFLRKLQDGKNTVENMQNVAHFKAMAQIFDGTERSKKLIKKICAVGSDPNKELSKVVEDQIKEILKSKKRKELVNYLTNNALSPEKIMKDIGGDTLEEFLNRYACPAKSDCIIGYLIEWQKVDGSKEHSFQSIGRLIKVRLSKAILKDAKDKNGKVLSNAEVVAEATRLWEAKEYQKMWNFIDSIEQNPNETQEKMFRKTALRNVFTTDLSPTLNAYSSYLTHDDSMGGAVSYRDIFPDILNVEKIENIKKGQLKIGNK